MAVEIQVLTPDNLALVRPFTDEQIRPDYVHVRDEFFRWQFHDPEGVVGPAWEPATLMAVGDGRVAALSLAIKTRFWVGGEQVLGAWHTDWFADRSCPAAGLMLIREQTARNTILATSGQSLAAANVFGRLRPFSWFDLERLFAAPDPDATLPLVDASVPLTREVRRQQLAFLRMQRVGQPSARTTMTELAAFDGHYDEVWDGFRLGVSLGTNRSAAYLNWRYAHHPCLQYQMRLFESQAGPAYFVWREEPVAGHGKCVARLCEALGRPEAIAAAFPNLYRHLSDRPVALADFFCSHAAVLAALRSAGMRPVITLPPFDLPRLYSPLAQDVRKTLNYAVSLAPSCRQVSVCDHGMMYLTKGDSNQDRPNP